MNITPNTRFSGTSNISNAMRCAGLALAVSGLGLGLTSVYQSNKKFDGEFNFVPRSAEEEFQLRQASIPGLLVMAFGGLLGVAAQGVDNTTNLKQLNLQISPKSDTLA